MKNKSHEVGLLKVLSYARYAVVGAIGGIAVYNTIILISTAPSVQSIESIAMGVGALLTTAAAKALHVA